jgi:DNA-binding NtrC family response regulator
MPARILIADDEPTIRMSLRHFFEGNGYEVREASGGEAALEEASRWGPDLALLDVRMPDLDGVEVLRRLGSECPEAVVLMMSAHADVEKAVSAMREGALDFLVKPVDLERLELSVRKAEEVARLRQENQALRDRVFEGDELIFGDSVPMRDVEKLVHILAQNPTTTVLLTGESGTGKGLIAAAIHRLSPRSEGPFLEVNCAGLSETFLESELFGHEKGAFTDAKGRKRGLLEVADGGTLFLDEIGDLALGLQPKLLRVLETQKFRRLGGVEDIEVDVRIMAATNHDLSVMIRQGGFREDLFYRLNVMPVALPPLRERGGDMLLLAEAFIRRFNTGLRKSVDGIRPEARELLRSYAWPGNVRELKNIVERAVILCSEGEIGPEHLPDDLRGIGRVPGGEGDASRPFRSLQEVEREHIARVLSACDGNRSKTSRHLGIARSTLLEKIRRYRLP